MTSAHDDPSREELEAMAYSDGELSPAERAAFERRMTAEPALARRVAEYRALELVAREMAPPEPADYEWERLELDPLYRAGTRLGNALVIAGGGLFLIAFLLSVTGIGPGTFGARLFAIAAGSLLSGLVLLLLTTVQSRLRTLPYDPYRKVKR